MSDDRHSKHRNKTNVAKCPATADVMKKIIEEALKTLERQDTKLESKMKANSI